MSGMHPNCSEHFLDSIIITTPKTSSVGQQSVSNLTNREGVEPWPKAHSGSKVREMISV